mmetsp:Transcript_32306/g.77210  ORF Transcript_32306/g.77210 Transcript_32306/m.77210 type:complete len:487 (+) Transcript_32306:65-1525(+)
MHWLLALCLWQAQGLKDGCSKPVPKAPVVFPDTFGATEHLKMFSGYVNVTDQDFLFYWFVKSEHPEAENAPLILWSNGGPGCTSMEGAATEIGPLILEGIKVGGFKGHFARNHFAWSKRAHLLFVDQPRYTGYSTGSGPFVLSSQDAAKDMVQFLRGWRDLFPEHRSAPLVLASESYGGRFVPAWAEAFLEFNERHPAEKIEVAAVALSNACLDSRVQGLHTFIQFAEKTHMLPSGYAKPTSKIEAVYMMAGQMGYVPNAYDYRRESAGPCCGCMGYNYSDFTRWFSRSDVRKSLNVCGDAGADTFSGCSSGCITFPDTFDANHSSTALATLGKLLDLQIPVMFSYGMRDATCDFQGGFAAASALRWSRYQEWRYTPMKAFHVGDDKVGQEKTGGGLTWIQIEDAGHMVPADNPRAAFVALSRLLEEISHAKPLQRYSETPPLLDSHVFNSFAAPVFALLALALAVALAAVARRQRREETLTLLLE